MTPRESEAFRAIKRHINRTGNPMTAPRLARKIEGTRGEARALLIRLQAAGVIVLDDCKNPDFQRAYLTGGVS